MNKFEKKALAKRAYRALIKRAEEGPLYQQARQQYASTLRLPTPESRRYTTKDYNNSYYAIPTIDEIPKNEIYEFAAHSPAQRNAYLTAQRLGMLNQLYNEDVPNIDPFARSKGQSPAASQWDAVMNEEWPAVLYMNGLGPNPVYRTRNRKPVGKTVLRHLEPYTKNMKQPIVETYPD